MIFVIVNFTSFWMSVLILILHFNFSLNVLFYSASMTIVVLLLLFLFAVFKDIPLYVNCHIYFLVYYVRFAISTLPHNFLY
jgi:hypothetical protein